MRQRIVLSVGIAMLGVALWLGWNRNALAFEFATFGGMLVLAVMFGKRA